MLAYSKPGHGATFKCYFPATEDQPACIGEGPKRPIKNLQGKETLMVVEDSEPVRKLAVNILKRQGYNVHWAPSGEECLRTFREKGYPIDLLITDVVMPDMNGKELFDRVVELAPHIKVLYTSGYTENVIAHHGVLDEGIHFIQKPLSVRGLTSKVREVLDEE